jgi:hypothetical protein
MTPLLDLFTFRGLESLEPGRVQVSNTGCRWRYSHSTRAASGLQGCDWSFDAFHSRVFGTDPDCNEWTHPRIVRHPCIQLTHWTNSLVACRIADMERVHLMRVDPNNEENATQMAAAKKAYPGMTSFGAWAAQKQKGNPKREKNWNQVSIGRLATGKQ